MNTPRPLWLATLLLATSCTSPQPAPAPNAKATILLAADVEWEKLNPARGDKSPQAATLWGHRKEGSVATGFLAKFVDGFSSPPHIHNATYRAVVISGLVHNDDPDAAELWMPPGSFWTQPKGEVHITSAKGKATVALVEIDAGPYLVMPPAEAFDSGERPVNVVPTNLVWVDPPGVALGAAGPQIAYLWGSLADGELNGTFVRLPAGSAAKLVSRTSLRAVVISGAPRHLGADSPPLEPGSCFSSDDAGAHPLSAGEQETVLYVRTRGRYDLVPGT